MKTDTDQVLTLKLLVMSLRKMMTRVWRVTTLQPAVSL